MLEAGKHVYGEKPLALSPAEAEPILRLAEEKVLRFGSAPDTVLGTGIQTARAVLDAGTIGKPVAATAFWGAPGHELWHPAPAFYYQPGAGPLFDKGPYYLTALVTLLGPITRVQGASLRSDRVRSAASDPESREIPVTVDTHVSAVLAHASGAVSTVTMSFDVWATRIPNIEVYGTAGTLSVPDPNHFSGPCRSRRPRTASGRTSSRAPASSTRAAAAASRRWQTRSVAGSRTGHPASSRSTCSRSWTRSSTPARRARSGAPWGVRRPSRWGNRDARGTDLRASANR